MQRQVSKGGGNRARYFCVVQHESGSEQRQLAYRVGYRAADWIVADRQRSQRAQEMKVVGKRASDAGRRCDVDADYSPVLAHDSSPLLRAVTRVPVSPILERSLELWSRFSGSTARRLFEPLFEHKRLRRLLKLGERRVRQSLRFRRRRRRFPGRWAVGTRRSGRWRNRRL